MRTYKGKRVFDLLVASFLLLILSPLLTVIALLIHWVDGDPVIFAQTRVGTCGKVFKMFKFRTMVVDAEELLEQVVQENNLPNGSFNLPNDPRQTHLGKFLRFLNIDELPQLINVIKGEMSLVGPRPPLPWMVSIYPDNKKYLLDVKRGVTGLYQIYSREVGHTYTEFAKLIELETEYYKKMSLGLDIKIIFTTISVCVKVVLRRFVEVFALI